MSQKRKTARSSYVRHVSHRVQRLQDDKPVRVLFWAQDVSGHSHLAVIGTDPRGSGHFTYCSAPDLGEVLGYDPQTLKCTNRTDVLNWLERLGARQVAINLTDSDLPQMDVKELAARTPDVQSVKRRRRPESAAQDHHIVDDAAGPQPAPRAGHWSPCVPPTAEALAVFRRAADPTLFRRISDAPEQPAISEFFECANRLAGIAAEVLPVGSEPPQLLNARAAAQAANILDRLLGFGDASLQLLEASNISPSVGRMRRHPDAAVAMKAEQLVQRWHAVASAVYVHAEQHLDGMV